MKSITKCILSVLGIFLFLFFAVSRWRTVSDILITLLYSLLFFVMLSPLCAKLERKGLPVPAAAALSVLTIVLVIVLLVLMILPYLLRHSIQVINRCLPEIHRVLSAAQGFLSHTPLEFGDVAALIKGASSGLTSAAGAFARRSMSAAADAGRLLFALIIAFYALKERPIIACHALLFIRSDKRETALLAFNTCKNALMGYLCGLMKTGIFIFVSTSAGLFIIGVDDALLLGFLMGIFEAVPYLGPILGAVPILLSAAVHGINRMIMALVLIILIQQAESSFIGPYFTASSTSLHPFAALLGVFILGSLFGLWGIVLAIPVLVCAKSIIISVPHTGYMAKA